MHTFYIFSLKDEFLALYQDNPKVLFQVLRQIYYMHLDEVYYGFNLFNQIINPLQKQELDMLLFLKLHQDYAYVKRSGVHIMNDFYKDEVSRLTVKKTHIKIETDQYPERFFRTLLLWKNTLFVCDFEQYEYFFLEERNISNFVN